MVCQIITNLAAQAEFRHGELVAVQAAVLQRLSALIVRAPEAPALAAGQDGCFRFICEAMTNVCREHKDGKKVIFSASASRGPAVSVCFVIGLRSTGTQKQAPDTAHECCISLLHWEVVKLFQTLPGTGNFRKLTSTE